MLGLLDVIKKIPVDVRAAMLANVFFIGGTAMIPGFPQRVIEELRDALVNDNEYSSLASSSVPVQDVAQLMATYFPRNMVPWIGGSIFAATESAKTAAISTQEYTSRGHRLPDWLSVAELE